MTDQLHHRKVFVVKLLVACLIVVVSVLEAPLALLLAQVELCFAGYRSSD